MCVCVCVHVTPHTFTYIHTYMHAYTHTGGAGVMNCFTFDDSPAPPRMFIVSWDKDTETIKVSVNGTNASIPGGSTIKLTFDKDDFPIV